MAVGMCWDCKHSPAWAGGCSCARQPRTEEGFGPTRAPARDFVLVGKEPYQKLLWLCVIAELLLRHFECSH